VCSTDITFTSKLVLLLSSIPFDLFHSIRSKHWVLLTIIKVVGIIIITMIPANYNEVPTPDAAVSIANNNGSSNQKIDVNGLNIRSKHSTRRGSSQSNHQQPTSSIPFPWKLHRILDDAHKEGFNDIISWVPSNNGFKVHNAKVFDEYVMPKYFDKTKYKSFQRQLNMWGFDRVGNGTFKGAYLHQFFIRGKPELCDSMQRTKIKGIHSKKLRKNSAMCKESLGGSSHSAASAATSSSISSSLDVYASIKAAADKVADLERQKEEIQRKLKLVSTQKANASAASEALAKTTSSVMSSSSLHGMMSQGTRLSLLSQNQKEYDIFKDNNHDSLQPLPLNLPICEGDSLIFGGQNFFFSEHGKEAEKYQRQEQPQRRRMGRRYSLEPKGPESDEYVLKEIQQYGDEDEIFRNNIGSGNLDNRFEDDLKYALDRSCVSSTALSMPTQHQIGSLEIMSPTPLHPSLDVITATTNISNNPNSSLIIGLDQPKRRFSFLSTPVQNPLEKPFFIQPRPPSVFNGGMVAANANLKLARSNNIDVMNMNNMMSNMMNMNSNDNSNRNSNDTTNRFGDLLKLSNSASR